MSTNFWRLAYNEGSLEDVLGSNTLPFPDFTRYPLAKNNDMAKVLGQMRGGHIVFLANLDANRLTGKIVAAGRIEEVLTDSVRIVWRRVTPNLTVAPSPQGGVAQWRNEAAFRFAPDPAKRYRLAAIVQRLFPSGPVG